MKQISPLTKRGLGALTPDAQIIHPKILALTARQVNALAQTVAISFVSSLYQIELDTHQSLSSHTSYRLCTSQTLVSTTLAGLRRR
jgi:hypothetical protein